MQLKVNDYQLPDEISFNFEELKQELTEKVGFYETVVYTDDQIKEAKADKANLNKLKKAINDERISREKQYMIPFNAFKAQVSEIIGIIEKPIAVIDKRVKDYEDNQKKEKLEEIRNFFGSTLHPDWLTFEKIFNEKWLNASVSMKSVKEDIDSKIEQIEKDTNTLAELPEFGFEAMQVYKSSLDINKALNEGHRMAEIQKQKVAEQERLKAEAEARRVEEEFKKSVNPPIESEPEQVQKPAKMWVSFSACMTVEQAKELKRFFDDRNIEFTQI